MKCKHCGNDITHGAHFCSVCGNKVELELRLCPYCGEPIPADASVCPICAEDLTTQPTADSGAIVQDSPKFRSCPYCGETIPAATPVCPICAEELAPYDATPRPTSYGTHLTPQPPELMAPNQDACGELSPEGHYGNQSEKSRMTSTLIVVVIVLGLVVSCLIYILFISRQKTIVHEADTDTVAELAAVPAVDTANTSDPEISDEYEDDNAEYMEYEDRQEYEDDVYAGPNDAYQMNVANGTIDGYPFRLEGQWADGSCSGMYINEYNGIRLPFYGYLTGNKLEIHLESGAGTFILYGDDYVHFEGSFTKGSRSLHATLTF